MLQPSLCGKQQHVYWGLQVAQVAHASGIPVLLDAGGIDSELSPELLSHISIISPNETELSRLTGMPTDTLDKVQAAAQTLQARGITSVLVKLGSDGSYLLSKDQPSVRQQAVKAPEVVDTTGAGDAYTAAFAVAMLEGKPPEQALLFASAAASLTVQGKGAQPSMPLRKQVDELLASL